MSDITIYGAKAALSALIARYWCPACDVERLDRIAAQLEDLVDHD